MKRRMRKWKKNQKWNHLKKLQREMIWQRQLETSGYQYQPSLEAYSKAKCQVHQLGLANELPGRDALKTVLMFLETYKPEPDEKYRYYILALKVARKKVEGRRFINETGQKDVVKDLDDVVQIIRESLRAAGIYEISVKDFIYSLV